MELVLTRMYLTKNATIGALKVDGNFECWICEDVVREPGMPKVHGQTAIPYGRYEIVISMSARFKVMLPLLLNVPNFSGIRIHPGNTAADTEGCLLPGDTRGVDSVGSSRVAFNRLMPKLQAALKKAPVFIDIVKASTL